MLHKNIVKLAALLWCVLTVASCTNEDFDKGNNGPDVPEGLPVTLKLNIGTPEVPVVETKSLDNQLCTAFVENEHRKVIYFGLSGQLILIIRVKPFRYGRPRRLDRNAQRSIRILPLK